MIERFAVGRNNPQCYDNAMTVAQVIKEIETLDPVERREVFAFVHNLETQAEREHKAPAYLDHASFQRAADEVFGKHGDLLRKLA